VETQYNILMTDCASLALGECTYLSGSYYHCSDCVKLLRYGMKEVNDL
jgi:hypothetical protein